MVVGKYEGSQNFVSFGPKWLKIKPDFYPPSVNSEFCFVVMALDTEVNKRNPTKLFQTDAGT